MYYFIPLIPLVYLWFFWAMYVLVMGLYRAYLVNRLTGLTLILSYPIVIFGGCIDILANLVLAPIIFLDIPREWMVTTRLQRYMKTDTGWRKIIASYVCENLLDIFDPTGEHC